MKDVARHELLEQEIGARVAEPVQRRPELVVDSIFRIPMGAACRAASAPTGVTRARSIR